jgi:hypothetical protein
MGNLKLEEVSFSNLKFLECGINARKEKMYGVKRHVKLQLEKLRNSIKDNGWLFPITVAEIPNGDRYLIDGYARWEIEDAKKTTGGFGIRKYYAIIVPANDLNHVKELYFQIQSNYGTPTWDDFRNLNGLKGEVSYELPGLTHPNFDLSIMTREDVAQAVLGSKYQII